MAQFDLTIHYIKGEHNVVADALSRRGDPVDGVVGAVSTTSLDRSLVLDILTGYMEDPFCRKLFESLDSIPRLQEKDGLLYLADRLVIPRVCSLREKFFHTAHDAAGHFGADKTYTALCKLFYWPNMPHNVPTLSRLTRPPEGENRPSVTGQQTGAHG